MQMIGYTEEEESSFDDLPVTDGPLESWGDETCMIKKIDYIYGVSPLLSHSHMRLVIVLHKMRNLYVYEANQKRMWSQHRHNWQKRIHSAWVTSGESETKLRYHMGYGWFFPWARCLMSFRRRNTWNMGWNDVRWRCKRWSSMSYQKRHAALVRLMSSSFNRIDQAIWRIRSSSKGD